MLDHRLVRTFVQAVVAIIVHRSRSTGLWLSELGGVLLSPDHGPAGTKRLSNLLLSPKWSSLLIDIFLWTLVFAYSRRWQIEHMWRACKNELAFESPRLHDWEHRRRLLLLASLVYAFLLELMKPPWEGTRGWVMHFWCHRTGAWTRQTLMPFTRLRTALSQLWIAFPPSILLPGRSSPGAAFRLLRDSG